MSAVSNVTALMLSTGPCCGSTRTRLTGSARERRGSTTTRRLRGLLRVGVAGVAYRAAAARVPLRMYARRDEGKQAHLDEDGACEKDARGQQGGREREQRHATPDNAPHDAPEAAR